MILGSVVHTPSAFLKNLGGSEATGTDLDSRLKFRGRDGLQGRRVNLGPAGYSCRLKASSVCWQLRGRPLQVQTIRLVVGYWPEFVALVA